MFSKSVKRILVVATCALVAGCSSVTTQHGAGTVAHKSVVNHKYAYKRGKIWHAANLTPSIVETRYNICRQRRETARHAASVSSTVSVPAQTGFIGFAAANLAKGIAESVVSQNAFKSCLTASGFKQKEISQSTVEHIRTLDNIAQKKKLEALMSGLSEPNVKKTSTPIVDIDEIEVGCKRKYNPTDTSVSIFERSQCI